MTSLSVGVSGLKTSQSAVNTTAHNLANVATDGYSRQQVLCGDTAYNKIGETYINYLQVGIGTEVSIVKQNRDVFFDKAYRLEIGRQNYYDVQSSAIGEIENLFGELGGVNFQKDLTDMWSSIEELAKEPDSIVKRTSLIETANTFMLRAQDIYDQIGVYQKSLDIQIQDAVDRINEIGQEIYSLNALIAKCEVGPEQANDYRDYRNVLLDELAEYVSISTKEDFQGVVTVNVEGTQFISPSYVMKMKTVQIDESTPMLTALWEDDYNIFNLEQRVSTEQDTDVGKLKSLLIARGSKTANYTDIPDRNDKKYYTTDDEGNSKFLGGTYALDVEKYNSTVGASVIMSVQSGFDRLVHGVVTAINDALCPNDTINNTLSNMGLTTEETSIVFSKTKQVGDSEVREETEVTETGKIVRTYIDDELVDETEEDTSFTIEDVRIWDEYNSGLGMDADTTPREELFVRQSWERYSEATITVTDEEGNTYDKTVWVYNEEEVDDPYSQYTIQQLKLNQDILQEPSKIPLSGNNYKGNYGGYDVEACDRLIEIWNEDFAVLNPNVYTTSTFTEYYAAFIGDIATVGSEYYGMYENQLDLVKDINNSRQEVSGVSSDEELSNMIMYQHAYNASSRYITAVDQMLEDILNKLG